MLRTYVERFVPVEFLSRARPVKSAPVEMPDAGARWGRPSAFIFSAQSPANNGPSFVVRNDDQRVHIIGRETHRQVEKVRVKNPDNEAQYFETESIKTATFYIGRQVVERGGMYPVIETIDEYLRFTFPKNIDVVGEGARGDAPPESTPRAPGDESPPPGVTPPRAADPAHRAAEAQEPQLIYAT